MKNKTIAVDLAKNVFQIGVSDRPGHVEKTYRLSRAKFLKFFVNRGAGNSGDGSLRIRPLLGSADTGAGTHGCSDLAAVCDALRQAPTRPTVRM